MSQDQTTTDTAAEIRQAIKDEIATGNYDGQYYHDDVLEAAVASTAAREHQLGASARHMLAARDAEIQRLRGALTNSKAVASDRIEDREKMLRDIMRERDEARAQLAELRAKAEPVDIVFTDRPGPGNECLFVEVERDGRSIRYGEWIDRPDGMAALRIPGVPAADRDAIYQAVVERLTDEQHERLCMCDGWPDACISGSQYTRHGLEPNGTEDTINALAELGYLRAHPAGESDDKPGEAKQCACGHPKSIHVGMTNQGGCAKCYGASNSGTKPYCKRYRPALVCPAPSEERGETR